MTCADIQTAIRALANPVVAEHSQRFFKTGKGEYGEGDKFLGVRVPVLRKVARKHAQTPFSENIKLLHSPYHEDRLCALFLLVHAFTKADQDHKRVIYEAYLSNTRYINNWDLVDSSAHQIVGGFLLDKDRSKLVELAHSQNLWERRISIIATSHFIRQGQYADTLKISKILLADKEDLIHKAVGWMLREVGKRDREVEENFLLKHYPKMPRTMLRYAIEKFSPKDRKAYLAGDK